MFALCFAVRAQSDIAGYLGVSTAPVDTITAEQLGLTPGIGLTVTAVDPDSSAATILEPYDILERFEDQLLVSNQQLDVLTRDRSPGDKVRIRLFRGGKARSVRVPLEERTVAKTLASGTAHVPPTNELEALMQQFSQQSSPMMQEYLRQLQDLPSLTDFAQRFQEVMDSVRVDVDALVKTEPRRSSAPTPPPAPGSGRSSVEVWALDTMTVTLTRSGAEAPHQGDST